MIRQLLLMVILAALLFSLSGCQTIAGAGRDITGASNAVESWISSK